MNEANVSFSIVTTHKPRLHATVKKKSFSCWLNSSNSHGPRVEDNLKLFSKKEVNNLKFPALLRRLTYISPFTAKQKWQAPLSGTEKHHLNAQIPG